MRHSLEILNFKLAAAGQLDNCLKIGKYCQAALKPSIKLKMIEKASDKLH